MEALQRLLRCTRRVKALCAPTGFGKTPVVIAYALITNTPTCIVTENRGLQDQYMDDFEGVGLVDIRGRRNYLCNMKPDYTCEDGYAANCPYKGSISCASSQAEMRASASQLVITNYDKWMAARRFGQGMQHFQQVIFDEGHEAPTKLANAMQVVLHHREIEQSLGLSFLPPHQAEEFVNWKPWAAEARARVELLLIESRAAIIRPDVKHAWIKGYLRLRNLSRRLALLSTANPDNWVVDEAKDGYQFDPVRVGVYAESTLLLKLPSVLVVSATLRPKTLYMLGISKAAADYQEFPSEFDRARCPIYYIPTMRVDVRAKNLAMLWALHDQIAARRRDRKGLVQTISYARRDEIMSCSRFAPQMIINTQGEPPADILDEFRGAGPGTILTSPSFHSGYDFPMKDAEWQFVCKIPFPDGRQKIIKARQEDDKEYGPFQAMNKLVQIFGRLMRSRVDQGESFIGDMHLDWFLPRYRHLAPASFHSFFRQVATVPPPPPPL